MPVDLHFPEYGFELATGVNDESAALDAPVFLSVHVFFFIDTIGLRHGGIFIAQQGKGQAEFLDEFLMGLLTVQAHNKNGAAGADDLSFHVTKFAGLLGTAWS